MIRQLRYTNNKTNPLNKLKELKEQCEMKHRLVFFDFEFLRFEYKLIIQLNKAVPTMLSATILDSAENEIKNFLKKNIKFYQRVEKDLDGFLQFNFNPIFFNPILKNLKKLGQELEEQLSLSYKYRCLLWNSLSDVLTTVNVHLNEKHTENLGLLKDLFNEFPNIECDMDNIIKEINFWEDVLLEDTRNNFLTRLEKFTSEFAKFKIKEELYLRLFFGDDYSQALKQQIRILFLANWYQHLNKEAEMIFNKYSSRDSLLFVLKTKHLVFTFKHQYYTAFYQNKDHKNSCNKLLADQIYKFIDDNPSIAAEEVRQKLKRHEQNLRDKVIQIEATLKNYGWCSAITSFPVRLFSESFYYKWTEIFFDVIEENTSGKFIHLKLDENYLQFFTSLLAGTLLAIDNYRSKWTGMSYVCLNTLTQFILSDLDSVIAIFKKFGCDEETTVNGIVPPLKWTLGLGIYISLYSLLYGLSVSTCGFFFGSYVMATACRTIVARLMDAIIPSKRTRTHGFVHGLAQQLGYIGGSFSWRYSYPYVKSFFAKPPEANDLLQDEGLCLQDKKRCKSLALEKLGLPKNVTTTEIHKKFRSLAKQLHPDKITDPTEDDITKYTLIRDAKNRLEVLI